MGDGNKATDNQNNVLCNLLREHAAWLNTEKQIIWRRFAASLIAITIYLNVSIVAYKAIKTACMASIASLSFSIVGLVICVVWLFQTFYGWELQNRRLVIIREIQEKLGDEFLKKWPLAFIPGDPQGQKRDWIFYQVVLIISAFIGAFLIQVVLSLITLCGHS